MYLKRNSYMVTSTKTLRYAHKIEYFYVYVCSVIITIHNTNDQLNEFNWIGSILLISYVLITCIKPTDSKFIAQRQLQTPQEDQWLTKHVLVQTVKPYSSIRKNLELLPYMGNQCTTHTQGYKQWKGFIIAQAPMNSTCRDFWKMVYERECGVIVMLSDLLENGEVG